MTSNAQQVSLCGSRMMPYIVCVHQCWHIPGRKLIVIVQRSSPHNLLHNLQHAAISFVSRREADGTTARPWRDSKSRNRKIKTEFICYVTRVARVCILFTVIPRTNFNPHFHDSSSWNKPLTTKSTNYYPFLRQQYLPLPESWKHWVINPAAGVLSRCSYHGIVLFYISFI